MWYSGGWNQFAPPLAVNLVLLVLAVLASGMALRVFARRQDIGGKPLECRVGGILLAWALAGFFAVAIIAQQTTQAEGRIAYVGLGGFAILTVLGTVQLVTYVRSSASRLCALAFWPVVFLLLNVFVLMHFVLPFAGW
jgi:hypothetical protein